MDKALNGMFWSSGSWLLIKISVLHLFLLTFPIKKRQDMEGNCPWQKYPSFYSDNPYQKRDIQEKQTLLFMSVLGIPPDK